MGQPYAVTVDQAGNTVFTDVSDNEVDVVAASSGTFYGIAMTAGDVYTVAGGGTSTTAGGPGATFAFNFPDGLVSDSAGNLVIADGGASQILVLANTDGTDFGQDMTAGDLYLVAGTGAQGMSGMGGPATSAVLGFPSGLAEDQAGNLLVADFSDNAVFAIAGTSGTYYGQSMTGGDIYTIADSSGVEGDTGDGGAATSATLDSPSDVAVDSVGNVLIADTFNNAIRVIAASSGTYYGQSMTAGDIYTLAGLGPDDNGFGGDDGPAGLAELNEPGWVALDDFGNVYVADTGNNRVRMIAASTGTYYGISMTAGDIYTVAGTGTAGYSGDAGPSGLAELNGPNGVAVTSGGRHAADHRQLQLPGPGGVGRPAGGEGARRPRAGWWRRRATARSCCSGTRRRAPPRTRPSWPRPRRVLSRLRASRCARPPLPPPRARRRT